MLQNDPLRLTPFHFDAAQDPDTCIFAFFIPDSLVYFPVDSGLNCFAKEFKIIVMKLRIKIL